MSGAQNNAGKDADCKSAQELAMRVTVLEGALLDIRNSTKEIAGAMVKIARLEERHDDSRSSIERAFNAIRELETKNDMITVGMTRIEESLKPLNEMRKWVVGGVISVVGFVGAASLKIVFGL